MTAFDTATQSLFRDPHSSELAVYRPPTGSPVSVRIVVTRGAALVGEFGQTLGGRMVARVRNVDAVVVPSGILEINRVEYRIAQILNDTGQVQELLLGNTP